MQTIPDFDKKLAALARTAVRVGLGVVPGQQVIITAPVEAVPLVRLVTAEAYQAGASLVTVVYADDEMSLLRLKNATEKTLDETAEWFYAGVAEAMKKGAARLSIIGDDPNLFGGQNPDHVARMHRARAATVAKTYMPYITSMAINWSIVAYATVPWARAVFPGLPDEEAMARLWEAIFSTSRVTGSDPVADWQKHLAQLSKRAAFMNGKRYSALHFKAPGTDLTVGLADNHKWLSVGEKAKNGATCTANIPSEEIFTTPHRDRVNGTARSTKPLNHYGSLIEGIEVRFENGRIVEARAQKGEAALRQLLASDAGAAQLGEVALVPHHSPISQSGLLFYETLFDENAACHIAIGEAYTTCFDAEYSADELRAKGANESIIHVDWMIGCAEMDIDGITQNGTREPVFRRGNWVD